MSDAAAEWAALSAVKLIDRGALCVPAPHATRHIRLAQRAEHARHLGVPRVDVGADKVQVPRQGGDQLLGDIIDTV